MGCLRASETRDRSTASRFQVHYSASLSLACLEHLCPPPPPPSLIRFTETVIKGGGGDTTDGGKRALISGGDELRLLFLVSASRVVRLTRGGASRTFARRIQRRQTSRCFTSARGVRLALLCQDDLRRVILAASAPPGAKAPGPDARGGL